MSAPPARGDEPLALNEVAPQSGATGAIRKTARLPAAPKCTVFIGSRHMICDLGILQRHSLYFKSGKNGMAYGLPIMNVSYEAFNNIYSWMNMPSFMVAPHQIMPVYRAAEYLLINGLINQYQVLFADRTQTREEVGFHVFVGMRKWDMTFARPISLGCIYKFFLTLITMPEYCELNSGDVCALLASKNIAVNSELEVLLAGIKWLLHDWRMRRRLLGEVLFCVCYECIPQFAIDLLMEQTTDPGMRKVFSHPDFLNYVRRTRGQTNNKIRYRCQRIWTYDPLCEYHHDSKCPERNHISLGQVCNFQLTLRSAPKLHWFYRQPIERYNCRNNKCAMPFRPAFRQ